MKTSNTNNPLLCDAETGVCEIPLQPTQEQPFTSSAAKEKPVKIVYFTDPICSACWAIEPQLRKLALEYSRYYDIEYRMGGLLPSWDGFSGNGITRPADVAEHWDEVSEHFQMPIIGDVWLEDPLHSSYPPSIAFKAVQLQDEAKSRHFLRKIREMVFLEKKNICRIEHLSKAVSDCGADIEQFKQDFSTNAVQAFEEDLYTARQFMNRGFPSLYFLDKQGKNILLYGVRPYEAYEQTILTLVPEAIKNQYDKSWEKLFALYPTLTVKEFSVLAEQPVEQAEQTLEQLYRQKKLQRFSTRNGHIYTR